MKKDNSVAIDFEGFPKIARLTRESIITEKIDGTNAQICIGEDGLFLVGSRTRWITPKDDNYGFAKWACENKAELIEGLGIGRHFGEWWGQGIQRKYGLTEKRFSLFNAIRWVNANEEPQRIPCGDPNIEKWQQKAPACCSVVPVLSRGIFNTDEANRALQALKDGGSVASPGFMRPEGIIVFHIAGNIGFKKTIEKDDEPKGKIKK